MLRPRKAEGIEKACYFVFFLNYIVTRLFFFVQKNVKISFQKKTKMEIALCNSPIFPPCSIVKIEQTFSRNKNANLAHHYAGLEAISKWKLLLKYQDKEAGSATFGIFGRKISSETSFHSYGPVAPFPLAAPPAPPRRSPFPLPLSCPSGSLASLRSPLCGPPFGPRSGPLGRFGVKMSLSHPGDARRGKRAFRGAFAHGPCAVPRGGPPCRP